MPRPLVRHLWIIGRAILLGIVLLLLLIQTYGLYIAVAVIPHQPWRRRVNFQLHRTLFTMDNIRLTADSPSRAAPSLSVFAHMASPAAPGAPVGGESSSRHSV